MKILEGYEETNWWGRWLMELGPRAYTVGTLVAIPALLSVIRLLEKVEGVAGGAPGKSGWISQASY
ncbi:MAG: hypothetical protein DRK00_08715 [Thermoprotei archaeon]|nr:MAG: hypothetical protein DRK00_08715 [Thermoprotei archaeon]